MGTSHHPSPAAFLRRRVLRLVDRPYPPVLSPYPAQVAGYLAAVGARPGPAGPCYLMDGYRLYREDGLPPSPTMLFAVAEEYGMRGFHVRRALALLRAALEARDPWMAERSNMEFYALWAALFQRLDAADIPGWPPVYGRT
ncbi:MAG TPA: hypothetical protein IAC21_02420 [Candidatus Enterenecus merdae]|nr:hypothetical protein [Candidatus Enterenecus merdae]